MRAANGGECPGCGSNDEDVEGTSFKGSPPPAKGKGIEREVPVEWLLEWLPDGSVVRVTFSLEHRSPPPLKQKNAWTYGISDNLPKRLQKPLSWNMVL